MAHPQVRGVTRTPEVPARAPQPPHPPRPGVDGPALAGPGVNGPAVDGLAARAFPPSFSDVLRHRYCTRLLVSSVAGRLSLGMVPVALILAAQTDGHSLATASVLAALYGIAPALGLPLLGRLADLRGLPLPCHLGAVIVATALGTLALAGTSNLPLAAVCVALAGAGCPPLEGGLRSLWHAVLPDDAHVRTAYTLDSSAQQIVYVMGPALAIAWATWFSPAAALAMAAAVTLAGSLTFATTRPARRWRAVPCHRERFGVLRPPSMRPLLFSLVFLGATVGALDVAGIVVAERQGAPWVAGALPAVFSVGGLLGGALFARFQPAAAPGPRHLVLLGGAFAAAWLPLLAPLPVPAVLGLAMLPGGLFVALLTVASLTVTSLAPPGTSTEAVGWISSAIRLGLAGGTALAGPLGGHFVVPLTAAALCALLLTARTVPAPAPAGV